MLFLLVTPASVMSDDAGSDRHYKTDSVVVNGTGYPPIKAQDPAQARLMARRAAILDAYRNALAGADTKETGEPDFYSHLEGFVSGITIIDEEYLIDGGLRIRAQVPEKYIYASSGNILKKPAENGPQFHVDVEQLGQPVREK